jgi:hypothetical protein
MWALLKPSSWRLTWRLADGAGACVTMPIVIKTTLKYTDASVPDPPLHYAADLRLAFVSGKDPAVRSVPHPPFPVAAILGRSISPSGLNVEGSWDSTVAWG